MSYGCFIFFFFFFNLWTHIVPSFFSGGHLWVCLWFVYPHPILFLHVGFIHLWGLLWLISPSPGGGACGLHPLGRRLWFVPPPFFCMCAPSIRGEAIVHFPLSSFFLFCLWTSFICGDSCGSFPPPHGSFIYELFYYFRSCIKINLNSFDVFKTFFPSLFRLI